MRDKTRTIDKKISREMVHKLFEVAQQFDIAAGGCYDARSGAINIWCTDPDKPEKWTVPIRGGNIDCDLVGTIWTHWESDDGCMLSITATPYELDRQAKRTNRRAEVTPEQLDSCLDFVAAKLAELLRLASLHPDIIGTKCPFCAFILPLGHLMNDLVRHITTDHHDVKVTGLIMSNPCILQTESGDFELVAAEKF